MVKRLKRILMEKYRWTVSQTNEEPFFETLELLILEDEEEQEEVYIDQLEWW